MSFRGSAYSYGSEYHLSKTKQDLYPVESGFLVCNSSLCFFSECLIYFLFWTPKPEMVGLYPISEVYEYIYIYIYIVLSVTRSDTCYLFVPDG